ncbi:MAG: hypothetical protein GWO02_02720 [Gammaproteobacteria bacterium]|nr:hypothetical protein [Gammaproteobacteria bacterium]
MTAPYIAPSWWPDDEVARACRRGGVGVFGLFEAAYREWYGREPDARVLERALVDYLWGRGCPPWVRRHAREVLARRPGPADAAVRPARLRGLARAAVGVIYVSLFCLVVA